MKDFKDRGLGRIGFIVPVSNSNLEPDMMMMRPEGVSLHFMRAGGYDLDRVPDSQQMRQFAESSLDSVMRALCAVRPDVVAYGCTSATLSSGPAYDAEFQSKIKMMAGVPALTAAGALVETLRDLGVKTTAFASPYTEQLNQEGAQFLSACGIVVSSLAYIGEDLGNYGQGELSPDEVFSLGLRSDHEKAEAVVLSCTDMRTIEVIEELESVLKKPVVTSNQALMHVASKKLGVPSRVPGKISKLTV
ncbi:MAG: maleate cis-trans isomerase family protein [bacterium]